MPKVKLTVTKSACRGHTVKEGDEFIVDAVCPPICHEFWNTVYPYVFALLNGADLDCGKTRALSFDARCPDGGRVILHGERIE